MKKFMKVLLVALLATLSVQSVGVVAQAHGNEAVLIGKKETWRYYNESPDQFPGEYWYQQDFNDTSWKEGKGVFGYKNTTPFDTGLDFGPDAKQKYPTYFFRKDVTLDLKSLEAFDTVNLNLNIDDGAVVFVNGKEISRYNYPEGPINYKQGTNQLGGNGKSYVSIEKSIEALGLVDGVNTFAVVLFQQLPGSSDAAFDLELIAKEKVLDITPTRISQTYNGDVETSKAFTWHTQDISGSDIRYIEGAQAPENLEHAAKTAGVSYKKTGLQGYSHKVTLAGLRPDTRYWYQVGDAVENVWSDVYMFETGNRKDGINVAFITDSQGWEADHYTFSGKTMKEALKTLPQMDFFLQGGDLVNTSAIDDEWHSLFEKVPDVWAENAIMTVSGNHDTHAQTFNDHYHYNYPAQDTKNGTYYSFDYDNAHFAMLNTNDVDRGGLKQEQFNWLKEDLRDAKARGQKWLIVTMHKGVQTVAGHIDDWDVVAMRQQLQPLFTEFGVDLVLQGHDHVYSRSVSIDGHQPEAGVEMYINEGVKTLKDPKGVTYVNANTSGVKFYAPKDDATIEAFGVYPDIKMQDYKQTYTTLEMHDGILTMNTYSFAANQEDTPQRIDSLAIVKDTDTLVGSMLAQMPEQVSDNVALFEQIRREMSALPYEVRITEGMYSKYLNLLQQIGLTATVTFGDGDVRLVEKGHYIPEKSDPTLADHSFKGWRDVENETMVVIGDTVIGMDIRLEAVWEVSMTKIKPNVVDVPDIEVKPEGDKLDETTTPASTTEGTSSETPHLPSTGVVTTVKIIIGGLVLVVLGATLLGCNRKVFKERR